MNSDQRNGTDYFTNKFISEIENAFTATNRDITWQSFFMNDLRPYVRLDDDVKEIAVKEALRKSKVWALQEVKEQAPDAFEQIKKTSKVWVSPFDREAEDLDEVSARELKRVAHRYNDEWGYGPITHKSRKPPPFPDDKYRVIYADPPWKYHNIPQWSGSHRIVRTFLKCG